MYKTIIEALIDANFVQYPKSDWCDLQQWPSIIGIVKTDKCVTFTNSINHKRIKVHIKHLNEFCKENDCTSAHYINLQIATLFK